MGGLLARFDVSLALDVVVEGNPSAALVLLSSLGLGLTKLEAAAE